jgi:endonuclease/exonuclease/phosphatase family metal-dependent hydrolase
MKKKIVSLVLLCLGMLAVISCTKKEKTELTPVPAKEILKVMSYNIHIANPPSKGEGFVDIEAIANAINKEKPDLVALQEVDRFTTRSGTTLDQAKEIAALTGMKYFFAKAINRSGGEYGVAVLSRFTIENSKVVSLPVKTTGAELRALGLIETNLPNGKKIVFASTHLDHLSDENRELQVREVIKALMPYQDRPVILGGDFNMPPQNAIWNLVREQFVQGCSTCPGTFPATNPNTTIDYLLLNKQAAAYFTVKDYYAVPERYASDHVPIVMKIEY